MTGYLNKLNYEIRINKPGYFVFVIILSLPFGNFVGWGICGKYLTIELSKLSDILLLSNNFSYSSVDDKIFFNLLKNKILSLQLIQGKSYYFDTPVLHTIRSKSLEPQDPHIRGNRNIGYTFFEDTNLSESDLENGRKYYDLIVTGSSWCEGILKRHGLNNVKTIIQGVDKQIFNSSNSEKTYFQDKFVIFSGGKFELRKGQDIVIKAFKILQEKYKDVLLVNSWFNHWDFSYNTMQNSNLIKFTSKSDNFVHSILQLLIYNGIDLNNVIVLPVMPNEAMAKIYKNTDIGLFPNRCEGGTNLVLMEYMACGKPVIASYNSGHKDILTTDNSIRIEHMKTIEHNGTVWDDPDLDETVSHLEWAYNNRDKLKEIEASASLDMSENTWTRAAQEFLKVLLPE